MVFFMKGKFLALTISILTLNAAYCSTDQSSIETHQKTIDTFDSTTLSELPRKKQRLDDRSIVKAEPTSPSDDATTNTPKEKTLLDLLLSQEAGRAFLDCVLILDDTIDIAIRARERRSVEEAEKTFAVILPYLSDLALQLSENKELSRLNDFGKYIQQTIESDKDFRHIPYEKVFRFAQETSTEIRKLIPDDSVWGFMCAVKRMIRLEYLHNGSGENGINDIEIGHKAQKLRVELKELYDLLHIDPRLTDTQNLLQISDSAMRHIKEIAKEFGPPISYAGMKEKVIEDLSKGIVTREHTKSPRDVVELSFDILGWIMQNWTGMLSPKMCENLPVLEKEWTNMFNAGDPLYISEAE